MRLRRRTGPRLSHTPFDSTTRPPPAAEAFSIAARIAGQRVGPAVRPAAQVRDAVVAAGDRRPLEGGDYGVDPAPVHLGPGISAGRRRRGEQRRQQRPTAHARGASS